MGKTWVVAGVAAALMLALAPAESAAQDAEAPAAAADHGLLQQLGIDTRPSSELGLEELQSRIDKLADLLEHGGLADDAAEKMSALLTADRAALKQRQAGTAPTEPAGAAPQAAEAAPAPPDPPPPAEAATPAPTTTATEQPPQNAEQTAPPAPEAAPPQQTAEQPAATTDQPAPPAEAPAPPAAAEEPAASAAPEQPAATTDAAPAQPDAPASVEAPPQVSAAAEEQAAALLADKTTAESLTDEALKARVDHSRALLDEPELSRKTAKALRQRLKADRQVLRARVAAQETAEAQQKAQAAASQQPAQEPPATPTAVEQTQQTQPTAAAEQPSKPQPQALPAQPGATAAPEDAPLAIAPLLPLVLAPTVAEMPMLLQDRRPAPDLADSELNRRILAQRELLQDQGDYSQGEYSQDDLTYFDRQLRQDRGELNRRLLTHRRERAARYEEWDNPNIDMNTEPDMGEPPAPDSIFAAEVDDEEMWNQLTAAPLEPLPRRYSRHQVVEEPEFVMNLPEVREAMPSIELDTITFGFNEAFVREEEIFDLDRIARMIESVVAAHPDEIFMIEGHTDAVGSDAYNLKLSRQRALAVKDALTRYYLIAPDSLATVGLGERYLKIWTPEAEEENRRVTVRRVTPLVTGYEME